MVALLIGFLGGLFAGKTVPPQSAQSPDNGLAPQTYNSPEPSLDATGTDARAVFGKIVSTNGYTITMERLVRGANEPGTLNIRIKQDAKIIRLVSKDPQDYKDQLAAYQQAVQDKAAGRQGDPVPSTAPSPFREVPVKVTDLHVGDNLRVVATDVVQDKESIVATEIRILATQ